MVDSIICRSDYPLSVTDHAFHVVGMTFLQKEQDVARAYL